MDKKENKTKFAPVVSVLGHVDHGKTSLLDKIRESSVASRERGGITQKIGASEVIIDHEGTKRKITFIDTPGHEAFGNMRSQGVNAADIVFLIIAADDGIMPQTKESIQKIVEAKTPFIVVLTKIDVEGSNIERVKQQVIKEGILLEGLGGDVPYIGVSSKTGEKIKDLLDLAVLVYDLSQIEKDENAMLTSVVIDAKLDKRRGILGSVIIKQGKLTVGNVMYSHGKELGKVKAIVSASGENIKVAYPGDAVEVMGLTEVLTAGSVLFDREVEPALRTPSAIKKQEPLDIMAFLNEVEQDFVPVVLKTETAAEIEAIKNSLPENIRIISEGQGEIAVSDVLMAKDFKALVLGFNVEATKEAKQLAEADKVFYKSYGIIYEMLDELKLLVEAVNEVPQDKELGRGQILASFMGTTAAILGTKVTEGRLAVGDRVKIMRTDKEMGQSEIISIRKGKSDTKLVQKNDECGIVLKNEVDFAPGDAIIAYSNRN